MCDEAIEESQAEAQHQGWLDAASDRPLLLTDGQYIFAHVNGKVTGPFVASVTQDGQLANEEYNKSDPSGLPFNPRKCEGGRIHRVENPVIDGVRFGAGGKVV